MIIFKTLIIVGIVKISLSYPLHSDNNFEPTRNISIPDLSPNQNTKNSKELVGEEAPEPNGEQANTKAGPDENLADNSTVTENANLGSEVSSPQSSTHSPDAEAIESDDEAQNKLEIDELFGNETTENKTLELGSGASSYESPKKFADEGVVQQEGIDKTTESRHNIPENTNQKESQDLSTGNNTNDSEKNTYSNESPLSELRAEGATGKTESEEKFTNQHTKNSKELAGEEAAEPNGEQANTKALSDENLGNNSTATENANLGSEVLSPQLSTKYPYAEAIESGDQAQNKLETDTQFGNKTTENKTLELGSGASSYESPKKFADKGVVQQEGIDKTNESRNNIPENSTQKESQEISNGNNTKESEKNTYSTESPLSEQRAEEGATGKTDSEEKFTNQNTKNSKELAGEEAAETNGEQANTKALSDENLGNNSTGTENSNLGSEVSSPQLSTESADAEAIEKGDQAQNKLENDTQFGNKTIENKTLELGSGASSYESPKNFPENTDQQESQELSNGNNTKDSEKNIYSTESPLSELRGEEGATGHTDSEEQLTNQNTKYSKELPGEEAAEPNGEQANTKAGSDENLGNNSTANENANLEREASAHESGTKSLDAEAVESGVEAQNKPETDEQFGNEAIENKTLELGSEASIHESDTKSADEGVVQQEGIDKTNESRHNTPENTDQQESQEFSNSNNTKDSEKNIYSTESPLSELRAEEGATGKTDSEEHFTNQNTKNSKELAGEEAAEPNGEQANTKAGSGENLGNDLTATEIANLESEPSSHEPGTKPADEGVVQQESIDNTNESRHNTPENTDQQENQELYNGNNTKDSEKNIYSTESPLSELRGEEGTTGQTDSEEHLTNQNTKNSKELAGEEAAEPNGEQANTKAGLDENLGNDLTATEIANLESEPSSHEPGTKPAAKGVVQQERIDNTNESRHNTPENTDQQEGQELSNGNNTKDSEKNKYSTESPLSELRGEEGATSQTDSEGQLTNQNTKNSKELAGDEAAEPNGEQANTKAGSDENLGNDLTATEIANLESEASSHESGTKSADEGVVQQEGIDKTTESRHNTIENTDRQESQELSNGNNINDSEKSTYSTESPLSELRAEEGATGKTDSEEHFTNQNTKNSKEIAGKEAAEPNGKQANTKAGSDENLGNNSTATENANLEREASAHESGTKSPDAEAVESGVEAQNTPETDEQFGNDTTKNKTLELGSEASSSESLKKFADEEVVQQEGIDKTNESRHNTPENTDQQESQELSNGNNTKASEKSIYSTESPLSELPAEKGATGKTDSEEQLTNQNTRNSKELVGEEAAEPSEEQANTKAVSDENLDNDLTATEIANLESEASSHESGTKSADEGVVQQEGIDKTNESRHNTPENTDQQESQELSNGNNTKDSEKSIYSTESPLSELRAENGATGKTDSEEQLTNQNTRNSKELVGEEAAEPSGEQANTKAGSDENLGDDSAATENANLESEASSQESGTKSPEAEAVESGDEAQNKPETDEQLGNETTENKTLELGSEASIHESDTKSADQGAVQQEGIDKTNESRHNTPENTDQQESQELSNGTNTKDSEKSIYSTESPLSELRAEEVATGKTDSEEQLTNQNTRNSKELVGEEAAEPSGEQANTKAGSDENLGDNSAATENANLESEASSLESGTKSADEGVVQQEGIDNTNESRHNTPENTDQQESQELSNGNNTKDSEKSIYITESPLSELRAEEEATGKADSEEQLTNQNTRNSKELVGEEAAEPSGEQANTKAGSDENLGDNSAATENANLESEASSLESGTKSADEGVVQQEGIDNTNESGHNTPENTDQQESQELSNGNNTKDSEKSIYSTESPLSELPAEKGATGKTDSEEQLTNQNTRNSKELVGEEAAEPSGGQANNKAGSDENLGDDSAATKNANLESEASSQESGTKSPEAEAVESGDEAQNKPETDEQLGNETTENKTLELGSEASIHESDTKSADEGVVRQEGIDNTNESRHNTPENTDQQENQELYNGNNTKDSEKNIYSTESPLSELRGEEGTTGQTDSEEHLTNQNTKNSKELAGEEAAEPSGEQANTKAVSDENLDNDLTATEIANLESEASSHESGTKSADEGVVQQEGIDKTNESRHNTPQNTDQQESQELSNGNNTKDSEKSIYSTESPLSELRAEEEATGKADSEEQLTNQNTRNSKELVGEEAAEPSAEQANTKAGSDENLGDDSAATENANLESEASSQESGTKSADEGVVQQEGIDNTNESRHNTPENTDQQESQELSNGNNTKDSEKSIYITESSLSELRAEEEATGKADSEEQLTNQNTRNSKELVGEEAAEPSGEQANTKAGSDENLGDNSAATENANLESEASSQESGTKSADEGVVQQEGIDKTNESRHSTLENTDQQESQELSNGHNTKDSEKSIYFTESPLSELRAEEEATGKTDSEEQLTNQNTKNSKELVGEEAAEPSGEQANTKAVSDENLDNDLTATEIANLESEASSHESGTKSADEGVVQQEGIDKTNESRHNTPENTDQQESQELSNGTNTKDSEKSIYSTESPLSELRAEEGATGKTDSEEQLTNQNTRNSKELVGEEAAEPSGEQANTKAGSDENLGDNSAATENANLESEASSLESGTKSADEGVVQQEGIDNTNESRHNTPENTDQQESQELSNGTNTKDSEKSIYSTESPLSELRAEEGATGKTDSEEQLTNQNTRNSKELVGEEAAEPSGEQANTKAGSDENLGDNSAATENANLESEASSLESGTKSPEAEAVESGDEAQNKPETDEQLGNETTENKTLELGSEASIHESDTKSADQGVVQQEGIDKTNESRHNTPENTDQQESQELSNGTNTKDSEKSIYSTESPLSELRAEEGATGKTDSEEQLTNQNTRNSKELVGEEAAEPSGEQANTKAGSDENLGDNSAATENANLESEASSLESGTKSADEGVVQQEGIDNTNESRHNTPENTDQQESQELSNGNNTKDSEKSIYITESPLSELRAEEEATGKADSEEQLTNQNTRNSKELVGEEAAEPSGEQANTKAGSDENLGDNSAATETANLESEASSLESGTKSADEGVVQQEGIDNTNESRHNTPENTDQQESQELSNGNNTKDSEKSIYITESPLSELRAEEEATGKADSEEQLTNQNTRNSKELVGEEAAEPSGEQANTKAGSDENLGDNSAATENANLESEASSQESGTKSPEAEAVESGDEAQNKPETDEQLGNETTENKTLELGSEASIHESDTKSADEGVVRQEGIDNTNESRHNTPENTDQQENQELYNGNNTKDSEKNIYSTESPLSELRGEEGTTGQTDSEEHLTNQNTKNSKELAGEEAAEPSGEQANTKAVSDENLDNDLTATEIANLESEASSHESGTKSADEGVVQQEGIDKTNESRHNTPENTDQQESQELSNGNNTKDSEKSIYSTESPLSELPAEKGATGKTDSEEQLTNQNTRNSKELVGEEAAEPSGEQANTKAGSDENLGDDSAATENANLESEASSQESGTKSPEAEAVESGDEAQNKPETDEQLGNETTENKTLELGSEASIHESDTKSADEGVVQQEGIDKTNESRHNTPENTDQQESQELSNGNNTKDSEKSIYSTESPLSELRAEEGATGKSDSEEQLTNQNTRNSKELVGEEAAEPSAEQANTKAGLDENLGDDSAATENANLESEASSQESGTKSANEGVVQQEGIDNTNESRHNTPENTDQQESQELSNGNNTKDSEKSIYSTESPLSELRAEEGATGKTDSEEQLTNQNTRNSKELGGEEAAEPSGEQANNKAGTDENLGDNSAATENANLESEASSLESGTKSADDGVVQQESIDKTNESRHSTPENTDQQESQELSNGNNIKDSEKNIYSTESPLSELCAEEGAIGKTDSEEQLTNQNTKNSKDLVGEEAAEPSGEQANTKAGSDENVGNDLTATEITNLESEASSHESGTKSADEGVVQQEGIDKINESRHNTPENTDQQESQELSNGNNTKDSEKSIYSTESPVSELRAGEGATGKTDSEEQLTNQNTRNSKELGGEEAAEPSGEQANNKAGTDENLGDNSAVTENANLESEASSHESGTKSADEGVVQQEGIDKTNESCHSTPENTDQQESQELSNGNNTKDSEKSIYSTESPLSELRAEEEVTGKTDSEEQLTNQNTKNSKELVGEEAAEPSGEQANTKAGADENLGDDSAATENVNLESEASSHESGTKSPDAEAVERGDEAQNKPESDEQLGNETTDNKNLKPGSEASSYESPKKFADEGVGQQEAVDKGNEFRHNTPENTAQQESQELSNVNTTKESEKPKYFAESPSIEQPAEDATEKTSSEEHPANESTNNSKELTREEAAETSGQEAKSKPESKEELGNKSTGKENLELGNEEYAHASSTKLPDEGAIQQEGDNKSNESPNITLENTAQQKSQEISNVNNTKESEKPRYFAESPLIEQPAEDANENTGSEEQLTNESTKSSKELTIEEAANPSGEEAKTEVGSDKKLGHESAGSGNADLGGEASSHESSTKPPAIQQEGIDERNEIIHNTPENRAQQESQESVNTKYPTESSLSEQPAEEEATENTGTEEHVTQKSTKNSQELTNVEAPKTKGEEARNKPVSKDVSGNESAGKENSELGSEVSSHESSTKPPDEKTVQQEDVDERNQIFYNAPKNTAQQVKQEFSNEESEKTTYSTESPSNGQPAEEETVDKTYTGEQLTNESTMNSTKLKSEEAGKPSSEQQTQGSPESQGTPEKIPEITTKATNKLQLGEKVCNGMTKQENDELESEEPCAEASTKSPSEESVQKEYIKNKEFLEEIPTTATEQQGREVSDEKARLLETLKNFREFIRTVLKRPNSIRKQVLARISKHKLRNYLLKIYKSELEKLKKNRGSHKHIPTRKRVNRMRG